MKDATRAQTALTEKWADAHEGAQPNHIYVLDFYSEKLNPQGVFIDDIRVSRYARNGQIYGEKNRQEHLLGRFERVEVFGGRERSDQSIAIATDGELSLHGFDAPQLRMQRDCDELAPQPATSNP
jgi:hypothetical protein